MTPLAPGPADRLSRGDPHRLRQAARSLLLSIIPSRWLTATNPVANAPPLLTFDDGPDPEHTPRVLDLLDDHGVQAVFFLIGERAMRHPGLVERIDRAGHLIGNHSWSHPAPGTMSTRAYIDDVRRARRELELLTGKPVRLFRPPHGHLTPATMVRLWRDRTQVMLWNVDPKDYAVEVEGAVQEHLRRSELRPGDVVLLHDTIAATVAALPGILSIMQITRPDPRDTVGSM